MHAAYAFQADCPGKSRRLCFWYPKSVWLSKSEWGDGLTKSQAITYSVASCLGSCVTGVEGHRLSQMLLQSKNKYVEFQLDELGGQALYSLSYAGDCMFVAIFVVVLEANFCVR